VRGFGSSVLNGKMELYKTFPNDLDTDQYVCFYFHVYSVLSDPSLNMWTLVPNSIPESVIQGSDTFSQSTSSLRIEAGNLNGANVTGTRNGTDFTYTTVENGYAILPVDPLESGDFTVTISKPNYVPLVTVLSPASASLALIDNDLANSLIDPNTTRLITLQVKNMTESSMSGIQLNLSSPDTDAVSIPSPQMLIPSLEPGATSTIQFTLNFSGQIHPRQRILFNLTSTDPSTLSSFQLIAGGAEFEVLSHSGTMALGQTNQIGFQVKNTGTQDLSGVVVTLHPLVNAMQSPNPTQTVGNWGIGETKDLTFDLLLAGDAYEGRYLPLYFQITGSPEYTSLTHYALTAGTPSSNDPTGPCNYGYFAYDSTDLGYSQTPAYSWVEIDPEEPGAVGQAIVYLVQDDGSRVVDLPFSVRYFGQNYTQITICSNGWLSFGATNMIDFYNCYIPAALGPKAMIAGYWDDLKGLKTGTSGGGVFDDMRICYWYDEANNRYIVEWNKAYNQYTIDLMEDASLEKFQIILYPQPGRDGDVLIQYHTVDNPGLTTNFCTVGIEDHLASDGVTYTHGNQYPITAAILQPGLAI
ncbi:MAG TPA: gingipain R, partial [Candidatus Cloacimonadota bacterium]|nr:gingipain R [Candidatus Cloacimonadota bacterium]